MIAVIQRVSSAKVWIGAREHTSMGKGLLVYIGVEKNDTEGDVEFLAGKIPHLRIFSGEGKERMEHSVVDEGLPILVVSEFTLLGNVQKGRRPDFTSAEEPAKANRLFHSFCRRVQELFAIPVFQGVFGAHMQVESVNDGPVTLLLNSRER